MRDWLDKTLASLREERKQHEQEFWVRVGAVQALELVSDELNKQAQPVENEETK